MSALPTILLIALGGATGAVARYLTYLGARSLPALPSYAATMTVNLLGCLLIGVAMTIIEQQHQLQREILMFGVVGFLGSYTTFSAFGLESYNLISSGEFVSMMISVSLNLVLGITAVWASRSITLLIIS
ncbi:MAG: CrcB family protein [Bdellovibrionales bacterium]|jgi:fluoride exporter|nr:CrcB family protein [Bdellovibrionales bacterium]MBT3527335.1 CrcB family protein [Bdellovibrionales bacterium]MBT7669000.1 CrcB family protein [Bdellovibrionales bacterium]MBT7765519.1 CrcB family protein [Bdellovibrionales bacterium]